MDVAAIIAENQEKQRVFFFSRDTCPYCDKLAHELTQMHVPFHKITIPIEDAQAKTNLVSFTNCTTFPQLFVGSTFVGGYSAFIGLVMTNQLQELFAKVNIILNDPDF